VGKKVKISISLDKNFLEELDRTIKEYDLASRSALFQEWGRIGFKKLKKDHGIPEKREIAISH